MVSVLSCGCVCLELKRGLCVSVCNVIREVGVLGQPLPDDLVISLTAQGRIGTSAERYDTIQGACGGLRRWW